MTTSVSLLYLYEEWFECIGTLCHRLNCQVDKFVHTVSANYLYEMTYCPIQHSAQIIRGAVFGYQQRAPVKVEQPDQVCRVREMFSQMSAQSISLQIENIIGH